MYAEVRCFLIEITESKQRYARCYDGTSGDSHKCSAVPEGYHHMQVLVDTIHSPLTPDAHEISMSPELGDDAPWPAQCACGRPFAVTERQTFTERLYKRADTGALVTLRDPPPGAIYRASWMEPHWVGADGKSYIAVCPNGRPWNIDGPASNCTKPNEHTHRCWIRHGEPPNFTVDKQGHTCEAGAGSIIAGDYHGFLRNGIFTKG